MTCKAEKLLGAVYRIECFVDSILFVCLYAFDKPRGVRSLLPSVSLPHLSGVPLRRRAQPHDHLVAQAHQGGGPRPGTNASVEIAGAYRRGWILESTQTPPTTHAHNDTKQFRSQWHHVIDVAPTILEAVDVKPPSKVANVGRIVHPAHNSPPTNHRPSKRQPNNLNR